MTTRDDDLKRLLTEALPLRNVGQQLREAARRAVLSGDRRRMEVVGRVIVAELRRRGDLVQVAAEDGAGTGAGWCVRRDTRAVVDLAPLGLAAPELPRGRDDAGPTASRGAPGADEPAADETPARPGVREVNDVLGAMEEAQNLELGGPRSGDAAVVLAGILDLLARFTPQFELYLMLNEPLPELADSERIFVADERDLAHGWLGLRQPGAAVWIPGPTEMPRRLREAADGLAGLDVAAAVPLFAPDDAGIGEGGEIGLLFVAAPEPWDRDPLLRLAVRLSRFVTRRWQQQQEVNQRIHTDSLTGVFNRAYFDSQFTLELERARRSNVPLSLIIADLDHFKHVNDRLGHHAGDRVLRTVARALQVELRRIDHVCRIGGEEFALVLPDTSQDAAHDVMRRLLNADYATDVVADGVEQRVEVTFSFGAVTFPDAGVDAFELYRKADAMLYLAKDSGRNRCYFWSSSGDHDELLPARS